MYTLLSHPFSGRDLRLYLNYYIKGEMDHVLVNNTYTQTIKHTRRLKEYFQTLYIIIFISFYILLYNIYK